jgi:hypothetical protein
MFEPIVMSTFHKSVKEGCSSFTVEVPKSYNSVMLPNSEIHRRQFYFSDLYLIPGFYKQRAAKLGLKVKDEEEKLIDLECRMTFTVSLDFYKDKDNRMKDVKFQHASAESLVDELIKTINAHFQATISEGRLHPALIIDWIDTSWVDEENELEILDPDVVVPTMTAMYYGNQDYSNNLYYNALELAMRSVPGVNNFKFPSQAFESPEIWSSVRLQIHIASNTKILVWTHTLLEQLGFSTQNSSASQKTKKDTSLKIPLWILISLWWQRT